MSVIFEQQIGDRHYSVRRHGASVRLYTDGVFHSQWNENRPFAGGVWDCLSLPVLYRSLDRIHQVLVLGVGGGAVMRQLRLLLPHARLQGVELDRQHLDIAERYFSLADAQVELFAADAREFMMNLELPRYDLLVEDLFGESDGQPERAIVLSDDWVSTLTRHVSEQGLLVVNSVSGRELARAAAVLRDHGMEAAVRWNLDAYDNAIGVFSRAPLAGRDWSRRLETLAVPKAWKRQARCINKRQLSS